MFENGSGFIRTEIFGINVQITDVTLREGEQTSGVVYSSSDKIEAGLALDRLGVDYIQAGFPAVGDDQQFVVRELSNQADATVTGLGRALIRDVDEIVEADADMAHIFAPLSDMQLKYLVNKSRDEILQNWREAVDHAKDHGLGTRIALIDAYRTEPEHVSMLFEKFSDVELIGLSDSVGAKTPNFVRKHLSRLDALGCDFKNMSVHFHDDLGLATANALAATEFDIANVDVSVGGVGERAGNTSLEEFVISLALSGEELEIESSETIPICHKVLETLGEDVADRKSILGKEVFKHESGIHTAAMMDEPKVFEPFDPSKFGGHRELIFGKDSGKKAAKKLLEAEDAEVSEENIERLLELLEMNGPLDHSKALEVARELKTK